MTLDRHGHLLNDDLAVWPMRCAKSSRTLRYHCGMRRRNRVGLRARDSASELQRPHSPIGRGSGLKIRQVSVRVRLGARGNRCWQVMALGTAAARRSSQQPNLAIRWFERGDSRRATYAPPVAMAGQGASR